MRLILAISRSRPDAGPSATERARQAFTALTGAPPLLVAEDGTETVYGHQPDEDDLVDPSDPRFCALLQRSRYTIEGSTFNGPDILNKLRGDRRGTLRSIAPPFGVCYRADPEGPVVLATDSAGLRQVYYWQGPDWAAMSSSGLILSWVVGAPINEEALATFATVGNYLLDQTLFVGVRKLEAGVACVLRDGRIDHDVYTANDAWAPVGSGGRQGQAARGVTVLRQVVGAALEAYPDAALELSGGFDSRAVLAAIPPAAREGRMALTLGVPGDADIRVAKELARRYRLDHRIVDLSRMNELEPSEVLDFARGAARRRDCMANPVATGVLDWVASQVEQRPRFSGGNAEFGRAHLYPGNSQKDEITDEMVERLARWRIMANHSADAMVLSDAFVASGREAALRSLGQDIRSYQVDWLRSLDEYYSRSRFQRWAGIEYTGAGYDRVVLAPFTQLAYYDWVRHCDPNDRRASRVFAAMFDLLDPDLAALPMATGVSPHEIAVGGPRALAKRMFVGTAQTTSKAWQRARRARRGAAGTAQLSELVVRAWGVDDPLPRLERYHFLDLEGVGRAVRGEHAVDVATVGLLTDLEVLSDFVDRAAATP